MIKLEFKELCKDKYTGAKYKKGDIVEFEEDRAKEILEVGNGKYARLAKNKKAK